jgi:hypothetical protein
MKTQLSSEPKQLGATDREFLKYTSSNLMTVRDILNLLG